MSDDDVLRRLRESAPRMGAVDLALLLERILGRPISDADLIFRFKQAFPKIPIPTLYEASAWHRIDPGEGMKRGTLTDHDFECLLRGFLSS